MWIETVVIARRRLTQISSTINKRVDPEIDIIIRGNSTTQLALLVKLNHKHKAIRFAKVQNNLLEFLRICNLKTLRE